jgi:hypothetical protein
MAEKVELISKKRPNGSCIDESDRRKEVKTHSELKSLYSSI